MGAEAANGFGLSGFGWRPEMCADYYQRGYKNAPRDGSPHRGDGPRVVRGGAAELYPWQGSGEWQLLLCGMRGSDAGWDGEVAVRPVIGLRVN